MGEGVVIGVLDALVKDFAGKLGAALRPRVATDHDARDPRRARCRATAARPSRTIPTGPVFNGNGPDDYVCVQCGNLLAASMDGAYMTKKVRVSCGALQDRQRGDHRRVDRPPPPLSGASTSRTAPVGRRAVAVDGGDPDQRRMPHRGRRQIEQRVVVRTLPLHAAESERPWPASRARSRRTTGASSRHSRRYSPASKPIAASGGYSSSADSRDDVKCSGPSTSITVPLGSCTRSTGSSRFSRDAASTVTSPRSRAKISREDRDRGPDRSDDRRVAPGLRHPLEADVALLAQPVELPAAELDAVLRGLASERGVWVDLGQSGASTPLRRRPSRSA